MLVGTSRKGFLGALSGGAAVDDRLEASLATATWAMAQGVAAVRVHDVGATVVGEPLNPVHEAGQGPDGVLPLVVVVASVSGDADPVTGYRVLVDGQATVIGGTSAVAPLWAALIARLNQALGRPVGLLNPALYGEAAAAGALRDIRSGDNGAYAARTGWDACTGLGSPDGAAILRALQSAAGTSRP